VITSKLVAGGPQYSIQVRNWKAGGDASSSDFTFKAPAGAKSIDVKDLKTIPEMDEMPGHFTRGDAK
jgi:hypothetical protein